MPIYVPTGIQVFDSNLRGMVLCTLGVNGYTPTSGLPILGAAGNPAMVTPDGELMITETERETNTYAAFSKTGVSSPTWGCLVDKSAVGVWPHAYTGRLHVSYLSLQVDRTSGTLGGFSVGVVTRTGATNGDALFFGGLNFNLNALDSLHLERQENFSPSQIKLDVTSSGTTPYCIGTLSTGHAALAVTGRLDSVLGTGTIQPAPGDIVVRFDRSTGTYNASTRILYHSHPFAP